MVPCSDHFACRCLLFALPMTAHSARTPALERTLLLPSSGGFYRGELNAEHQPHGQGTVYRPDGSEAVSGQWIDGKLHGPGKRIYLDGGHYEGQFECGAECGLGSFTWADGRVYEGEFADNGFHGLGIMWDQEGTISRSKDYELSYCGRWSGGEFISEFPVPRSKILVGALLSASGQWSSVQRNGFVNRSHQQYRCLIAVQMCSLPTHSACSMPVGLCSQSRRLRTHAAVQGRLLRRRVQHRVPAAWPRSCVSRERVRIREWFVARWQAARARQEDPSS